MKIKILYEDKDVLVMDKPSGLVVHSDGRTKEASVADWVAKKYPALKKVGEPLKLLNGSIIERPGIVHRLDRDTSGALLIAKNQKTFLNLKKQFQNRGIKKLYRAFVYGKVSKDTGTISTPIARSKADFRKYSADDREEDREAVTHYIVRERGNNASYLEVIPKTGRTHQIRVHLRSIGYPVIGDKLYAPTRSPLLRFKRLALHAHSITFRGNSGENITVESPLPPDFKKAERELANAA